MTTRAGLYLRVSTEDQAREGFSIPAQRERLLAFCRAQGWDVAGIYPDEGISGASLKRPALDQLRADVAAGRVNLVLVWRVDRLSRRVSHLAQLAEEFDRAGAALRSVTEPFDTSHAAGRAFLHMLATFAELERETIRERSRLGIAQRIRSGLIHGRPTPIGYRRDGGAIWLIDPAGAAAVRWIYQQYLGGVGSMRIAQALMAGDVPAEALPAAQREFGRLTSVSSAADRVRWILKNPVYAGYAPLHGDLYPGRHEAIIDEAAWRQAQALRERRRGIRSRAQTSRYILSGILYCAECGGQMWGYSQDAAPRGQRRGRGSIERGSRRREFYICRRSGVLEGRAKRCTNWGIARHRVEATVLERLRQIVLDPKMISPHLPDDRPDDLAAERRSVQQALGQVERRRRRVLEALEAAPDLEAEMIARLREISEEQRALTERLAGIERESRSRGVPVARDELAQLIAHVRQVIDGASADELREIVRLFVRRVEVTRAKDVRVEPYPLG